RNYDLGTKALIIPLQHQVMNIIKKNLTINFISPIKKDGSGKKMIMRYKKAISPLIATIILIAVTIAIAVIVVGWIYGIFGSTSGPTEKLQIFQDARLVVISTDTTFTGTKFNVTLKNIGTSVVTIQKVYVKENASCTATSSDIKLDSGKDSLKPGDVATLSATFNCQVVPGITYTVIIVTGGGQSYSVPTTAEQG
ncbi:MAG: archaellin/type IV pilin N-terminal domain-containing protein, partial [Sulfolobales archaeon]